MSASSAVGASTASGIRWACEDLDMQDLRAELVAHAGAAAQRSILDSLQECMTEKDRFSALKPLDELHTVSDADKLACKNAEIKAEQLRQKYRTLSVAHASLSRARARSETSTTSKADDVYDTVDKEYTPSLGKSKAPRNDLKTMHGLLHSAKTRTNSHVRGLIVDLLKTAHLSADTVQFLKHHVQSLTVYHDLLTAVHPADGCDEKSATADELRARLVQLRDDVGRIVRQEATFIISCAMSTQERDGKSKTAMLRALQSMYNYRAGSSSEVDVQYGARITDFFDRKDTHLPFYPRDLVGNQILRDAAA